MIYIDLLIGFLKVGLFSFGGGYVSIALIRDLLKSLLKNKVFQGALSGLRPCIIGIILATGIYMIWKNFNVCSGAVPDIPAIALTIVLEGLYFGLRKLIKKKISPIMLICVSAVCGMIVYGW